MQSYLLGIKGIKIENTWVGKWLKTRTLITPKVPTRYDANSAPIPLMKLDIIKIMPIAYIDRFHLVWYQYER